MLFRSLLLNLQVSESFFIEATSGQRFSLADNPYNGVEFVWNNQNYWICMQMAQPHSDSRAAPSTINWNLSDTVAWEPLLESGAMVRTSPRPHPRLLNHDRESMSDVICAIHNVRWLLYMCHPITLSYQSLPPSRLKCGLNAGNMPGDASAGQ